MEPWKCKCGLEFYDIRDYDIHLIRHLLESMDETLRVVAKK